MNAAFEQVRVLADLEALEGPQVMGYLSCQTVRGNEVF